MLNHIDILSLSLACKDIERMLLKPKDLVLAGVFRVIILLQYDVRSRFWKIVHAAFKDILHNVNIEDLMDCMLNLGLKCNCMGYH